MEQFASVAVQLRELRKNRGLLQREVAELSGLYQGRISEYETGARLPSVFNMLKLCTCLELYPEQAQALTRILLRDTRKLSPNEQKSILQNIDNDFCKLLIKEYKIDLGIFQKSSKKLDF